MKNKSLLQIADEITSRNKPEKNKYGTFEENFKDAAQIASILTNTNITLSVIDKKLNLGTWQGVFLFEHRTAPKDRFINLHYIGDLINL